MVFNSLNYLLFFPVVTLLYYIFPYRMRWLWLLMASYFFYMNWNAKYALLMMLSTIVTYLSGILIQRQQDRERHLAPNTPALRWCRFDKKFIVFLSFFINLSILFFFKYFNFANNTMAALCARLSLPWNVSNINVLLPVGISFYTFQALSYTMDVYRGSIKAERHFGKYALFVSFFPQLVAGPIESASNLLPQFERKNKYNYARTREGLIRIGLGFFKKVVIADRLAVFVDTIYNNAPYHEGLLFVIATFFFAIQIYCDFSGYSDIAIGSAKVLGYDLMTNFDKPYFSKSVAEFWRRWHISLSSWFREYLYIPLGGNRHGALRKYINVMIVFVVSGLWHGAAFTYIIWGFLNGFYQLLGSLLRPAKKHLLQRLRVNTGTFSYQLGQRVVTFLLICFAWIFFRANSLSDALYIIRHMLVPNFYVLVDDSLFTHGLSRNEFGIGIFSVFVLFVLDYLDQNHQLLARLKKQNLAFRWLVYLGFIAFILVFGYYGSEYNISDFIYFQF